MASKPCNHRNRYWAGEVKLNASPRPPVVESVHWCMNCGAITFAGGWRYPKRALERKTKAVKR